jgi:hypothetical protein
MERAMRRLGFAVCLVLAWVLAASSQAASEQIFDVSVTGLQLAPNERVAEFEVIVTEATFYSLRAIPSDWVVHIDNTAAFTKASCQHGASRLDPGFFDKLFSIEKGDRPGFSIKMELVVTVDFDEERTIVLREPDIKLVPR